MRSKFLLLVVALVACDSNNRAPVSVRPQARSVAVRANDSNVLSVYVAFDSQNVTSARVLVSGAGEEVVTPSTTIVDGAQQVLVLGLLPEADYTLTLEYVGAGETVKSTPFPYRTAALPAFLRNEVEIRVPSPGTSSGGYILTNFPSRDATRHYIIAFDDRGRIRWYRYLPGIGAYGEQLPNGNYITFVGSTTGYQRNEGYFVELSPAGTEVGRYQAPLPQFYTDNHELLLTPAPGGGFMTHYFSYDIRVTDTSQFFAGGRTDTNLAGHQLRRYKPNGELDFLWDAWDHFRIDDWIEEPAVDRTLQDGDFDHPNSLTFDLDGNYIVSWRNMAEVTKIDSRTGAIIYRFGGNNNEFRILNDPLYVEPPPPARPFAFCGQHSVQVLSNGNLLMFDNGLRHRPRQSRAVEYRLDVAARTATMVWEFRHNPPLYTPFTGNVDRLPNGNTIVGFAFIGDVVEVDPAGSVIWEAAVVVNGLSTVHYRFKRIQSLYGIGR